MTKTLTEQWRDGTLDERIRYYFRFPKGRVLVRSIHSVNNLKKMKCRDKIECLDAVPPYEDYLKLLNESYKLKLLEKRLEIATKALEYYAQCKHLNLDILTILLDKHKNEVADFEVYEDGEHARKALKEMEGVK